MRKLLTAITLIAAAVSSCTSSGNGRLLPKVSGKAGEIVIVMERCDWEGEPGIETRELLAGECPWLAQVEPMYSLINVTPSGFADLFRVHRNIVFFHIGETVNRITYFRDVWAEPQCVIEISATDAANAVTLLKDNGKQIQNVIEQAERDRVIRNCILYEEATLAPVVRERFGGSPHFPIGYSLKKATSDFVWIADEKQYTMQGVFIYKYPADSSSDALSCEKIIGHRNEILKANVPGMFENTWMTTSTVLPPTVEYLKYKGRELAQTRGLWDVVNDFMGGPFVSHSFYSPDGKHIIVAEAFVYAPKYDKRQYLRQVESIIYSWEWYKK